MMLIPCCCPNTVRNAIPGPVVACTQVPTSDINLPVSLMNILWSLMDEFRDPKATVPPKDVPKILEGAFLFALIWSIGGSIGEWV